jgi:hypothetical protein
MTACGPLRHIAAPRDLRCERGIADVEGRRLWQWVTLLTRSEHRLASRMAAIAKPVR